jgi:hypothetical protein
MKYLFITALAVCLSTTAFAQEKKEATVKVVVIENGKERVIERKFADFDKADAELKKLNDSLGINVTTTGGKKKIVRVDVNKSHSSMSDQPGVTIERMEGGPEGGADKRIIIRRGGPGMAPPVPGVPAAPGAPREDEIFTFIGKQAPLSEGFNIELDGPMGGPGMKMNGMKMNGMRMKRLQKMMQEKGSKTIHGLTAEQNQPFNGKLNVHFAALEKGNVVIAVSDVNGKEIATETVKDFQGEYLGQIDLKKSGAGVYFLRVTLGTDGAVRRIEVK